DASFRRRTCHPRAAATAAPGARYARPRTRYSRSLIAAEEKRVEARLVALKAVEAQITVPTGNKEEAEAARFKGLVTMYESMKPRDGAKLFDRLAVAGSFVR